MRLLWLFLLFSLVAFALSSPTQRRTLVLLEDDSYKTTHSEFFHLLENDGQRLSYFRINDPEAKLQVFGEYLYDNLVLFASGEILGGVDAESILRFVDDGRNVLLATNSDASEPIRELTSEVGVQLADKNTHVVDHLNHEASDFEHSLIVTDQFVQTPPIVGASPKPVLYRGIGLSLKDSNRLVFPILTGDSSAFSTNLEQGGNLDLKLPTGRNVVLVAGLQARNNARIVVSGSLELFSNSFFESSARKNSDPDSSSLLSGNQHFSQQLSRWAFLESGALRVTDVHHKRLRGAVHGATYRIKDEIQFSATINEWNGSSWIPFFGEHVQLEIVRLDPYVRIYLQHKGNGLYQTNFTLPDVYGVFTFRLLHNRLGWTFLHWQEIVSVRPFRHDEYERFIPAAYPYYTSSFSMMFGFFLFTLLFLYHRSNQVSLAKKTK